MNKLALGILKKPMSPLLIHNFFKNEDFLSSIKENLDDLTQDPVTSTNLINALLFISSHQYYNKEKFHLLLDRAIIQVFITLIRTHEFQSGDYDVIRRVCESYLPSSLNRISDAFSNVSGSASEDFSELDKFLLSLSQLDDNSYGKLRSVYCPHLTFYINEKVRRLAFRANNHLKGSLIQRDAQIFSLTQQIEQFDASLYTHKQTTGLARERALKLGDQLREL